MLLYNLGYHVLNMKCSLKSLKKKKEQKCQTESMQKSCFAYKKFATGQYFIDIGITHLLFLQLSHFETPREPQLTVTAAAGKNIQISLSKRIENPEDTASSDLILTWEQFFMSLAKLSAKKQGHHEKNPHWTVSNHYFKICTYH